MLRVNDFVHYGGRAHGLVAMAAIAKRTPERRPGLRGAGSWAWSSRLDFAPNASPLKAPGRIGPPGREGNMSLGAHCGEAI